MTKKMGAWLPALQDDDQYRKMVEALLGGAEHWETWQNEQNEQEKNQTSHMAFYDFQYLEFSHKIEIDWTKFTKEINFGNAIFNKEVIFLGTEFEDVANFAEAEFSKDADFRRIAFNKHANFAKAIFNKDANFTYTALQKSGLFGKAKFYGDKAFFHHITLSSDSNLTFAGASFENAVPDIRFLNRIPDMRFHGFSVPSPDKLIKKNKWKRDNEDRYRKLKELAIGNDNHEYELLFYGYEMDSKLINFDAGYQSQFYSDKMNKKLKGFFRVIEKKFCNKKWWINFSKKLWKFCNKKWKRFYEAIGKIFVNKNLWKFCNKTLWKFYGTIEKIFFNKRWRMDILPTRLYKFFSNYGQSVGIPILLLFGIWIAPFVYDCIIDDYIADNGLSWHGFSLLWFYFTSLWLTLTSLDIDILFKTIKPIMPFPLFVNDMDFGDFITKIIASVFWFLFFLGMRNKFKI